VGVGLSIGLGGRLRGCYNIVIGPAIRLDVVGFTLTLATISPKESRVGRKMVGITVELVSIINCRTEKRYRMIAA
jgi:hypothetical protein